MDKIMVISSVNGMLGDDFVIYCVHESVTPEEVLRAFPWPGYIADKKFNEGWDNGCACDSYPDRRHWRVNRGKPDKYWGKCLYRKNSSGRVYSKVV